MHQNSRNRSDEGREIMHDFAYSELKNCAETDGQFVAKVAAAAAEGRWDSADLPRLLAIAKRGAKQPPDRAARADELVGCLDRFLGDRFAWRHS
jgi:hypothetical protein